jgi:multiple sugar transport system substrate-binding protein
MFMYGVVSKISFSPNVSLVTLPLLQSDSKIKSEILSTIAAVGDKKLTRRSDKLDVSGMTVGLSYQTFNPMVWQNGGQILNEAKTAPAFNDAVGLNALTYWLNAIKEVSGGPEITGIQNFLNGKIAMLYQNSANAIFTAMNAGLNADELVEIIPPLKQKVAASVIFTPWLAIGGQSKYPDLAWDFIKLHMSMEYYPAYIEAQVGVPSRMAVVRSDYVKKSPWLTKLLTFASQYGRATWTARNFPDLRDTINPELTKAYNGTATPQEALQNAANKWKEILTRK